MAHHGFVAFRPRSPLAYFDFGIDSFAGNSIFLEAHRRIQPIFGESRQSTSVLRFGQLSTAHLLQMSGPLRILFSAFGAITLERERHTLRLLLRGQNPLVLTVVRCANDYRRIFSYELPGGGARACSKVRSLTEPGHLHDTVVLRPE